MVLIQQLLILSLLAAAIMAQCPAPADLKLNSVCARMFEDSSYYNDKSCGGSYLDAKNGDDFPFMPLGWGNRISSMVVATRCEIRVWSTAAKLGNNRLFSTGTYYQLRDYAQGLFGDWNNAISSYYCKCN
ncbi:syncollin-like [Protopterus annectens]|uniref:syncollin-like n=1 Tax=Protopterus annectens TaxID=7888 RepID=UPI001CFB0BF8|nr:syncollin-like [Protopterus annectens]